MGTELSRNPYFDNLKGILILLVIIGHALTPLINRSQAFRSIYVFVFMFHMPAFIFVSGYFSHKKSSILSLVFYFVIFDVLYRLLFMCVFKQNAFSNILTPSWIMWYLLSLITWRFALRFVPEKWNFFLPFLLILAGLLIGMYNKIGPSMSLSRTFVFAPFFFAGYLVGRRRPITICLDSKIFLLTGIIIIILAITLSLTFFKSINIGWLYGSFGYKWLGVDWSTGIIIRSLLYLIAGAMCLALLAVTPTKASPFAHFGRHSLKYYLGHGFALKFLIVIGAYSWF